MTREEFISSFADVEKLHIMDTLLGDIYDEIGRKMTSPEEIIKRHLQGYKENISCDTRIVEILRNSEIARLKERVEKLNNGDRL